MFLKSFLAEKRITIQDEKPGTWAVAASLFSSLVLLVVKCCSFFLFQLSLFHLCRYFFSMRLDLCYLIFYYQVFWKKNLSQNKNNIAHKFKVLECYLGFKNINPMNASYWNHLLLRNLVINDIYPKALSSWLNFSWMRSHISIFTIWLKG